MPNLLKVRLSLKGRPIRSYTFNKKSISIGRDPGSDIFLDNTGISRNHAHIERTPGGYVLEDLGSANGTYLNDQPVRKDYVGHDDVIHIGKFAMWLGVESDRRDKALSGKNAGPAAMEGTMVIDRDDLLEMQKKSTGETVDAPPAKPKPKKPAMPWAAITVSFFFGVVVGVFTAVALGL